MAKGPTLRVARVWMTCALIVSVSFFLLYRSQEHLERKENYFRAQLLSLTSRLSGCEHNFTKSNSLLHELKDRMRDESSSADFNWCGGAQLERHIRLQHASDLVRVQTRLYLIVSKPRFQFSAWHQVQETHICVPVGLQGDDKFKMCVHSMDEDMYVSGALIRDGVWEPSILQRFVQILDQYPQAAVIDSGAQLGMYGMQAAKKGRKVGQAATTLNRQFTPPQLAPPFPPYE
jgi:hypothetical protein